MIALLNADTYIAVRSFDNLVRQRIDRALDFWRVEFSADQTLDNIDGVLGIGDRLGLCNLTDQSFAFFGESDNRWSCATAFPVRDNLRYPAFKNGNTTVRRAQIDADDFAHSNSSAASQSNLNQSSA